MPIGVSAEFVHLGLCKDCETDGCLVWPSVMLSMENRIRLAGHVAPKRSTLRRQGYTLIEVITVVLILSILAFVAVPRLNLAAVTGARANAFVSRIATDLRRARANAIMQAAWNPTGFAVVMMGGGPYTGYQIIDLYDAVVVETCEIPDDVRCSGGQRFEFGPLGNLRSESDTELRITAEGKEYLIEVIPATGAVKWTRRDD